MDATTADRRIGRYEDNSLWRKIALAGFKHIGTGTLVLIENGTTTTFGNGEEPRVEIEVLNPKLYRQVCLGGDVGAAEAFMDGHWRVDNLTELVRLLLINRAALESLDTVAARLAKPALRFFHWMKRNSVRGSKRNISAHYDLGNDFFRLFLDPTLMYSAAVFPTPDASLEEAAKNKLDLICQKLELKPHHHVLEIGTGWGGFAIHAAKAYGCKVTTTTISKQQYEYAKNAVAAAGLTDKVEVIDQDYRLLAGSFDRIVSIEMIEAVGHQYLDSYFRKIGTLLKPEGSALIQAIVMADHNYERAKNQVDFIKRYIFPGGFLPSVTAMMQSVAKTTDCMLVDLHDIGLHYADTLHHWRHRFQNRLDEIHTQGFSEEFTRLWEYYFCYCEGAFRERAISNVQLIFQRSKCRDDGYRPLPSEG